MLRIRRILVRGFAHAVLAGIGGSALFSLVGCGQTGSLYLPTEPAAARRATLPQSMWPVMPERRKDAAAPPPPASSTSPAAPEKTQPPASP